jgi:hypothetical protein
MLAMDIIDMTRVTGNVDVNLNSSVVVVTSRAVAVKRYFPTTRWKWLVSIASI